MALRTVARRKGDGASARGPVRGPAHQIIPEQRVPSLRLPVLSVQLARIAADGRASCKRQVSGSNPLTGSQFSSGIDLTSSPIRGTNNADPGLSFRYVEGRQSSHRATAQRVFPGLRARRDRPAHPPRDPPEVDGQYRVAGPYRARQAAQGSIRRPHSRVRCHHGQAAG